MTDKEGLERLRVLAADAEKMKPGPYEFLRDGAYGDVRVRATGEAIATDIAARPAELWAACSPEVILGLIERVEVAERIANAADGLLTADTIVHPTLTREAATREAWQRLSAALGPWHARQCASSAFPAPQEPEGR
jgi:hypothetical protein